MDIFLIIGIFTGLFAIVGGMILKGANPGVLLTPAAMVIIIVGTIAAVANSFPKKDLMKFPKIVGALFREKQGENPTMVIKQITEMAQKARKDGLLSLEQIMQNMDNKFMKSGIAMVIDGFEINRIREVLEMEIESMEERHRLGASFFTVAGGAAPTLGVLGAVIGLIGALGNLNDTEKLGHMIAAAFVATLYGIFIGYSLMHPCANRLKRKSHAEIEIMNIILEGVLAIQSGENPKSIEMKLVTMLEPKERLQFDEANKEK